MNLVRRPPLFLRRLFFSHCDPELERLLEPERRRQVASMIEAMKRVRSAVFE